MDRSRKAALWSKRLAACERSGLSRRAWCAAHGINVHTLDYWRYRLRARPAAKLKRRSQALVPIVVSGAPSAATASTMALRLPGGIELSAASLDARWLAILVRELRAC